jgi:hypothetical protein
MPISFDDEDDNLSCFVTDTLQSQRLFDQQHEVNNDFISLVTDTAQSQRTFETSTQQDQSLVLYNNETSQSGALESAVLQPQSKQIIQDAFANLTLKNLYAEAVVNIARINFNNAIIVAITESFNTASDDDKENLMGFFKKVYSAINLFILELEKSNNEYAEAFVKLLTPGQKHNVKRILKRKVNLVMHKVFQKLFDEVQRDNPSTSQLLENLKPEEENENLQKFIDLVRKKRGLYMNQEQTASLLHELVINSGDKMKCNVDVAKIQNKVGDMNLNDNVANLTKQYYNLRQRQPQSYAGQGGSASSGGFSNQIKKRKSTTEEETKSKKGLKITPSMSIAESAQTPANLLNESNTSTVANSTNVPSKFSTTVKADADVLLEFKKRSSSEGDLDIDNTINLHNVNESLQEFLNNSIKDFTCYVLLKKAVVIHTKATDCELKNKVAIFQQEQFGVSNDLKRSEMRLTNLDILNFNLTNVDTFIKNIFALQIFNDGPYTFSPSLLVSEAGCQMQSYHSDYLGVGQYRPFSVKSFTVIIGLIDGGKFTGCSMTTSLMI